MCDFFYHSKKRVLLLIIFLVVIFNVVIFGFYVMYDDIKSTQEDTVSKESIPATPTLFPASVRTESGEVIDFRIAKGLGLAIASEGMDRIRFMDTSSDGRLFLTDMKDLTDNTLGKIYILEDFDSVAKKFLTRSTYLDNLRNPNDIVFYTDEEKREWLYVALTDVLVRYPYAPGDLTPLMEGQVVATFPAYGLGYKYGGWHLTRSLQFIDNTLYVSIGSSCNVCEEKKDEYRALVLSMNPDGSNSRVFATGLRNAVGLTTNKGKLYATNMGVDHLGDDLGDDTFFEIRESGDYGWPYCYHEKGVPRQDETSKTEKFEQVKNCEDVPVAEAYFPPHSAPLDVEYMAGGLLDFPEAYWVALHGSGDVNIGSGYSVVSVQEGEVFDVLTGFLDEGKRIGRPAGILDATREFGGVFISDDHAGRLYFVFKK